MSKTIAILQSSYIPWKGYFDIIASVDEFVIFDDVQYTRRDWRNRNRVIVNGEPRWLTIPVASKGKFDAAVNEMLVDDQNWANKHWGTLRHAYAKAPHFREYEPLIADAYESVAQLSLLTDINVFLLKAICGLLELPTRFVSSDDVPRSATTPTDRLIEICRARGATDYVSGPAARDYIKKEEFSDAGVSLYYANYSGYPSYPQGTEEFVHGVSILDGLFRCGRDVRDQLKSPKGRELFLEPA